MPDSPNQYLNLEYLNEMAEGEDEFLIDIIAVYLTSIPGNLKKLAAAIENHDRANMLFFAHKLKGSFNFIGSAQISAVFNEIEELAELDGSHLKIPPLFAEITRMSDSITAGLQDLLQELKNKHPEL